MSASTGRAAPASGQQFEINHGPFRAQVGQVAAVLRGFWSDGVRYTETWPDGDLPPMGAGMVLAPWPNRVAGGRWRCDGVEQRLDLTEPERGNAIHGLLRWTGYQQVAHTADAVTVAATVFPQHGWPFQLLVGVSYALSDRGLTVTYQVDNVGSGRAPFGVGSHPYLRVGEHPVAELRLAVPAGQRLTVDDRMIPNGSAADDRLAAGVVVGSVQLDGCFTGLTGGQDGRTTSTLTAPDGRGVALWADAAFGWIQVFTPAGFPDPAGPRRAVAVEPMTCPPDALNSGDGLIWLAPGESWSGSWGLTPFTG